jgi:hypothetical protein
MSHEKILQIPCPPVLNVVDATNACHFPIFYQLLFGPIVPAPIGSVVVVPTLNLLEMSGGRKILRPTAHYCRENASFGY